MSVPTFLSYFAAYFCLITAAAVLLRDRHSFVHRAFAVGMLLFALEEYFQGSAFRTIVAEDVVAWQKLEMLVIAVVPAVWLAFSAVYARANFELVLHRWKWPLIALAGVPVVFTGLFWSGLFTGAVYLEAPAHWSIEMDWPARALEVFFIAIAALILFNLERTLRSSTGRMRWQIKFLALGVGGLFALRIYLASQALLFSTLNTALGITNALALIAVNALFAFSLWRASSLHLDVYLSRGTIQTSLTIVFVGIYLLSVSALAQISERISPNPSIPVAAFVIFLALTALAGLLLSNRLRRRLRIFVSTHFRRPIYDYRKVWMELTERTTSLMDATELGTAVSRMISESLDILSVSVWLVDDSQRRLTLSGSTALSASDGKGVEKAGKSAPEFLRFLSRQMGCVVLDEAGLSWPEEIDKATLAIAVKSRMRYAVPLRAGKELVGVMTLNDDRVGRKRLSGEDVVLLETLAAQLAACLLNLKLSDRLRHAKEVETFQTVSTFFVHDLKNLASRLSLTMQNLPGNFDNPEFREDALRVISTSLEQIDDICARLTMLRQNIELRLDPCDLNYLVASTLTEFKTLNARIEQDLQPVPKAMADPEQIHKVLTNLVMNANEALNGSGVIHVSTIHDGSRVGFAVRDNGCGMSEDFIERSLFKPFQTTKKRGLGIGLFHTKLIVEAHRGTVEVNSTVGAGTEFRVLLPAG